MKSTGVGSNYPGGHTGSLYNGVNNNSSNRGVNNTSKSNDSGTKNNGCLPLGDFSGLQLCPSDKCPDGTRKIEGGNGWSKCREDSYLPGSGVSSGDSYSGYSSSGYPTGSGSGGYGYSGYDSDDDDDFMINVSRFNKLNNLDQKALSDLNKPENKEAKWALDYMCSLYCAGANNPDHQGYYLFSNAHTYALSKSTDTSKSFFAHYMDSLVNQGANDPSHKFYYIFENAHKYALDNQSKIPEKKEIIETKQSSSLQEQEKQKSDKWAKNYMDSLVNQGGSDSSHPAYYLFSNAHTYALSKSIDTSKSFFAHYMDSLVSQGANNPQNPHYYMFVNAHTYALKNQ